MTISINDFDSQEVTANLVVPNGTSLSQIFDCTGFRVKWILTPAALTSATWGCRHAWDGVNTWQMADPAATFPLVGIAFAANNFYQLIGTAATSSGFSPDNLPRYLQIATSVAEAASRTFVVGLEPKPAHKP